jgi:hypothetical protein
MDNPIHFETLLSVTLQAQQWNQVIALLNDTGPYKVVAPLITEIAKQFQAAAEEHSRKITGNSAMPMPNGVDHGTNNVEAEAGSTFEGLRPTGEGDGQGR